MHLRTRTGALPLLALLAACGGPTVPQTSQPETAPPTESASPSPTPIALVETPLDSFTERGLVFANVEFTLTGARLSNREPRSYAQGGEPVVDEADFYAYLDLTATNLMLERGAELDESWYRLELEGVEIVPDETILTDLGRTLAADTPVASFLAFPVPADADLAAGTLVFGDGLDVPAFLPLSGEVPEQGYPIDVDADGEAVGIGITNGATMRYTLLGATVALDIPLQNATPPPMGIRADEGKRFLTLEVRVLNETGRVEGPAFDDQWRLLVDDVPIGPWEAQADASSINVGAATEVRVGFVIPTGAGEVVLQVGDPTQEPGLIPIELADLP